MDQLPKELYALVFSHLTQREKLQCLLVNRHWYEKIKQVGNLFSPLTLIHDHHKLEKAIKYFENQPNMAHQINNLIYDGREAPNDELFVKLPVLFGNLKTLDFKVQHGVNISNLIVRQGKDAVSKFQTFWSSTLRSIRETNTTTHPLTSYILSHPCLHLTSVSLEYYEPHFYNNLWESDTKATKDTFIANLTNAAQLTTLKLIGVHLTMRDFELIHQKLPALKELVLHKFTFRLNDTLDYPYDNAQHVLDSGNAVIVADPAPAPSLEHLEILMFYDNDLEFQDAQVVFAWLPYLGKKYKNLIHFTLSFLTDHLQHTLYNAQLCQEHLLPILEANSKMETFDFPLAPIAPEMARIMDASGMQLQRIAISAQVYSLGRQLSALAESKQRSSISSVRITLRDDANFDPDGRLAVYEDQLPQPLINIGDFITRPLERFSELTHLDLNGEREIISITWLPKFMKCFKHLVSVRLDHIFYTELFGSQPFVESHVKDISLQQFSFYSVPTLERCCEQLSKMLRLCPDLESFAIKYSFYGLDPYGNVDYLKQILYDDPLLENKDQHDVLKRAAPLKLDFRQNTKLKKIYLDASKEDLYVCVYRNNDKHCTLYQAPAKGRGRLTKISKSRNGYHATLYLNSNPVTINSTLIMDERRKP